MPSIESSHGLSFAVLRRFHTATSPPNYGAWLRATVMEDAPPPYDPIQDPAFQALIYYQNDSPQRNGQSRDICDPENRLALVIFLFILGAMFTGFYVLYSDPRRPR
ncbi:hypothetical protein BT63DRAFT_455076 [Microthyrium microscopicum]|uniref:Uncharacterized protein n=1 Tax=Microthyrium microscopicum TaxID=703497 RepID=A0A6A6UDX8_9PEZI|nr:hypothetical protein BT63DRAFT_455076 [Microthyrium microscopicum]